MVTAPASVPTVPPTGPAGDRPAATPDASPFAAATVHPFTWSGNPWRLAPLALLNAVLTIVTLGIYNFWGRTELRRRIWSSVRLLGEPLTYHGTPTELLRGFLIILFAILLPLSALGLVVVLAYGQSSGAFAGYQIGLFLVVYPLLAAFAHYRARRYRLSRTAWRGIRGTMVGSSGTYAGISWATALAYPVTLGWIAPWRAVLLQRRLVSETELGALRLTFTGSSRRLYRAYALLWFGTAALVLVAFGVVGLIIGQRLQGLNPSSPVWVTRMRPEDWRVIIGTLVFCVLAWSLISSFYYARLYNLVARESRLTVTGPDGAPVRFELDTRGRGLMWLFLTNSLITYLSATILRPVATARSLRYFAERFRIVGAFDPASLAQNKALLDPSGEGLAQAFDFDGF